MVNYVKTTNGYFYKICKNGKKRISEDEYNKRRKIKKMMGGVDLDTITIQNDTGSKTQTMENVFFTDKISENRKTSSISKISTLLMRDLQKFKNNRNYKNKNGFNAVYVGEIKYTGDGHLQGIQGNSHIWLVKDSNNYRYIVEINKDDTDTYPYPYHVKFALKSLCNLENSHLIIEALKKIDVQLDESKINVLSEKKNKIPEINQQINELKKNLRELQLEFVDISLFNHTILQDFEWTFTV